MKENEETTSAGNKAKQSKDSPDAGRDGIPAMRAIAESLAAAAHDTSSRSAT